ncbi:MAG: ABC transporter permease [Vulcanimicrobiaceae bacterium]
MNVLLHEPARWLPLLAEHLALVLGSLAAAMALALPLAAYVAPRARLGGAITSALAVLYTIPSLALLALLVPPLGIGAQTAFVALVAYAEMILVRSFASALQAVDPALLDAARGLGLDARARFLRVALPAAAPGLIAGVRIATVTLVSLATLAAWVDGGGLGVLIFYGLEHQAPQATVAGAILCAALALAADRALRFAERRIARD